MLHLYSNASVTTVSSVSDDKNGAWTQSDKYDQTTTPASTNANAYCYTFKNSAAGATVVTVTFGAATTFIAYTLSEWFNVDQTTPVVVSTHNEGTASTTTWSGTTANITVATSNLCYQSADATVQPLNATSTFTPKASPAFQLESVDLQEGLVAQSYVSTSATFTPSLTSPTSATYASLATVLAAASAGQDSTSAFRVKRAQNSQYVGATVAANRYQFPTDGNLQVCCISIQSTANNVTSIGGGYSAVNNSPVSNGVGGTVSMFHSDNTTPSRANSGTFTMAAAPGGTGQGVGAWFLDIIGANTSPLDTTTVTSSGKGTVGVNTGNQAVASSTLAVFQFTPTAQELGICYLDHNSGSETGSTATTGASFIIPYNGQDGGAGGHWTMDSGLAFILSSANTTMTFSRSATAAGNWESIGALFKAAAGAAGSVVAPRLTLLGVR